MHTLSLVNSGVLKVMQTRIESQIVVVERISAKPYQNLQGELVRHIICIVMMPAGTCKSTINARERLEGYLVFICMCLPSVVAALKSSSSLGYGLEASLIPGPTGDKAGLGMHQPCSQAVWEESYVAWEPG